MDYKFIILLILVLVLIFLFVKETATIKEEINNNAKNTRAMIANLDRKIDVGFTNCVNKIRVINGEYVVQVRKMNELGSQMIIPTTSNGYSDSDSVKNSTHKIPYLSDDANNVKLENQKKQESEKSPKKNDFQINYQKMSTTKSAEEKLKRESEKIRESEHKVLEKLNRESEKNKESEHKVSHDDSSSDEDTDNDNDNVSIDISFADNELPRKKKQSSSESSNDTSSISISAAKQEEDLVSEHESIVTNDIKLTLEMLKPIEKYKRPELEKISRLYSIPTTIKEGNTRRPHRKEELYEMIKEKLEEKRS